MGLLPDIEDGKIAEKNNQPHQYVPPVILEKYSAMRPNFNSANFHDRKGYNKAWYSVRAKEK